jgi:hypothetical protein
MVSVQVSETLHPLWQSRFCSLATTVPPQFQLIVLLPQAVLEPPSQRPTSPLITVRPNELRLSGFGLILADPGPGFRDDVVSHTVALPEQSTLTDVTHVGANLCNGSLIRD